VRQSPPVSSRTKVSSRFCASSVTMGVSSAR
jgi:hypothetical protein